MRFEDKFTDYRGFYCYKISEKSNGNMRREGYEISVNGTGKDMFDCLAVLSEKIIEDLNGGKKDYDKLEVFRFVTLLTDIILAKREAQREITTFESMDLLKEAQKNAKNRD